MTVDDPQRAIDSVVDPCRVLLLFLEYFRLEQVEARVGLKKGTVAELEAMRNSWEPAPHDRTPPNCFGRVLFGEFARNGAY